MANSPQKSKKSEFKPGVLESNQVRASQNEVQRRRDMAVRSTLSRLRNRKSALK